MTLFQVKSFKLAAQQDTLTISKNLQKNILPASDSGKIKLHRKKTAPIFSAPNNRQLYPTVGCRRDRVSDRSYKGSQNP